MVIIMKELFLVRLSEQDKKFLLQKKKGIKIKNISGFCFSCQLTEGGAEITGFHNENSLSEAHFVIPAELDSHPVISVGEHIFDEINKEIRSVYIPPSVRNIHPKAFVHCVDLTACHADENSRYFCSEGGILFSKDKKEILCFPKAYKGSVYKIPDTVETIGAYAFAYVSGICKVSIHKNVRLIGNHAFYRSSVTEISDAGGVRTIGEYAFCSSRITTIKLPSELKELSKGIFKYCSMLKKITVPDEVTAIQDGAFQKCSHLDTVLLPEKLRSVGINAFEGCRNLTSIIIPPDTVYIGSGAFENCMRLNNIKIPRHLTEIGENVFKNCIALEFVTRV